MATLLVAAVSLWGRPASLAGDVDTATLSGTVYLDPEGSPLPGLTVTATDEARGVATRTTTDAAGAFRLPLLRPSTYTVAVDGGSFAPYRREGLVLEVGRERVLRIGLRSSVAAAVEVRGESPLIDPTSSDLSTNITPDQVKALPLPTRNYLELAFLAPGTTPSRDAAFKGVVSAGAQEARNAFVSVDGADNNNFILGGQLAALPPDAIQEFQVVTNDFAAEYGRTNSVVVNVLTKSGTNMFHGSAYEYYRDQHLTHSDFYGNPKAQYRRNDWGATAGGPIAPDKAFFFLSYDDLNQNVPAQVTIPLRPDLSGSVPVRTKQKLALAKVDVNAAASHHLTLSYRYEDDDLTNQLVGGSFAASYGYAQTTKTHAGTLTDDWLPSTTLSNQLRAYGYHLDQASDPNSTVPQQKFPTYSTGQNFRFPQGGTEQRVGVADTASWSLGDHFVKGGVDYSHWRSATFFALFSGGQFVYSTRPTPDLYIVGVGDPSTVNTINFVSVFAQDEWRPTRKLTVNAGLRWDYQDEANNSDFVSQYPFIQAAKPEHDHYQPRVGFAYDFAGDGKTVLRGGGGIYYAQIFNNASLNEDIFDGQHFKIAVYPCRVPAFASVCANPSVRPTIPPGGVTPPPDIRVNDPNLVTPYTISYNLGLSRELSAGWAVRGDLVYTRGLHELVEVRENLRASATDPNSLRPHPQVGSIRSVHSGASSEYMGLLLHARKQFGSTGLVDVSYTLSKATNETEFFAVASSDSRAANPITVDRGPARQDQRHRFVANGLYRLPFGLTGSGILTWASGQPWSERLGIDANLDDSSDQDRPAGVGRNSHLSNTYFRLDLRLAKGFVVGPVEIEAIAELFNVTNNHNFDPGTYSNVVSAADFGQPRASANGLYQPRQLQLAARVSF